MNFRTSFFIACLALSAATVSAPTASAQGRGMGFGPSFSRLLNMTEVQNELKLQGDALEKVKAFAQASQTRMQDEVQNIRDQGLSEEDTRTEIASLVDELYGKDVEDLTAILSPDQMKRVKQLMLQQQGASAIARKEVAEAIGLAEDTRVTLKKKIDEMNAASREKMRELFQGGDRDEIRKVMNENRKALEEAVLATLSDAQKAKFTEMKGAEFKFPEPQAGGNRRRDF